MLAVTLELKWCLDYKLDLANLLESPGWTKFAQQWKWYSQMYCKSCLYLNLCKMFWPLSLNICNICYYFHSMLLLRAHIKSQCIFLGFFNVFITAYPVLYYSGCS